MYIYIHTQCPKSLETGETREIHIEIKKEKYVLDIFKKLFTDTKVVLQGVGGGGGPTLKCCIMRSD